MTLGQDGRRRLLIVALIAFPLMGAAQALYGPSLPMLARETGQSAAAVSLIFSVHWIGSAAGVVAMFALGARATPRMVLAALALGTAALGAGLGWGMMLAGAALAGFGQGCAAVLFNPRVLTAFGPRGPAMLGLVNAVFGAGAIVAPLVLVALDGAYAPLFLVIAAGYALTFAGARDEGAPGAVAPAAGSGDAGGLRPDWVILAFGACGIGFEASLIGLGPAALVRAGLTEAQAAAAQSGFFVAFLAARLALMLVAHRIAPMALYAGSVAGVALAMAAAVLQRPDWMFIAAGAAAALIFQGYFVEAASRMGRAPRVSSVIIAAGLAGGIALPFALARLAEMAGPRGFFVLMAGLAALVTLAALTHLAGQRARRNRQGA